MIKVEDNRSRKTKYIHHQNDNNLNFDSHFHDSFEILACYEGEIEIQINNAKFVVEKNKAVIIFPNQIHSYKTIDNSSTYICIFSTDYCDLFNRDMNGKKADNPVFDWIYEYENTFKNPTNIYHFISTIHYLLSRLVENTIFSIDETKKQHLFVSTLNFISENFTDTISLKQLADNLCYDYHYISSYFNKYFGKSFSLVVNDYRLNYAKQLIISTDLTFTEIANRSGFGSIRNFNRSFQSIENITPKEYRQNHLCKNSD